MVVKSKRGRRRYVLFKLSPGFDKESLIRTANRVCSKDDGLYIIQCKHDMAIVRCTPENVDHTIDLMLRIDSKSTSIKTSGTLKTIRDSYPEMKADPRKR